MGDRSKIEWIDATWNPIRARRNVLNLQTRIGWHCTHVSESCADTLVTVDEALRALAAAEQINQGESK